MEITDINCDLGEGEEATRTEALMRLATSANVACGGHAGTAVTMDLAVRLARRHGVWLGAHPGICDGDGFGRGGQAVDAGQLKQLLAEQVGVLEEIARGHGARVHHVKLHGALYHAADKSEELARAYVETVRAFWPEARIYCRAGGKVAGIARELGAQAWEEVFLDRGYLPDGTLVPRGEPGALVCSVPMFRRRLSLLQREGKIEAVTGERIRVEARTFCVHSDTPQALRFLKISRGVLSDRKGSVNI